MLKYDIGLHFWGFSLLWFNRIPCIFLILYFTVTLTTFSLTQLGYPSNIFISHFPLSIADMSDVSKTTLFFFYLWENAYQHDIVQEHLRFIRCIKCNAHGLSQQCRVQRETVSHDLWSTWKASRLLPCGTHSVRDCCWISVWTLRKEAPARGRSMTPTRAQ